MSFRRRFVYLVVDGICSRRAVADGDTPSTFHLHRINMSRFFYPKPPPPTPAANAMVNARLPRPSMSFHAPSSEQYGGSMHFMLLGSDKVLATDQTGRAAIYDAGAHAMRTAPILTNPKDDPISISVEDNLYILDADTRTEEHCFEALVYERGLQPDNSYTKHYDDWRCHPLPPPPFHGFPGDAYAVVVDAYAVVGGSDIWVSTEDGGTYSFDTARRAWAKQGDWKLPFEGLAEYVPEHNLWFGLSSNKNSHHLCTFDLAGAARRQALPAPRNVWEDLKPPKDWKPLTSYLVHLGSGRFCVARFFETEIQIPDYDMNVQIDTYGVFTGVEVERCGKAGRGLRMVKHRSECYHWDDIIQISVL